MYNNIHFPDNLTVYNVEKYGTAKKTIDGNTLHALCMLDN
jgi:hypothetical protein